MASIESTLDRATSAAELAELRTEVREFARQAAVSAFSDGNTSH